MSEQQKTEMLEEMLNKVKPKARYVSEMHIEENIDSLMKEIINGDIDIPEGRDSVENIDKKSDFEAQIKERLLHKVQREKMTLEQKLSYINTSIKSLKKYDHGKNSLGSSRYESVLELKEATREKDQQVKKYIAQRAKSIEEKKKKVQEAYKKRLEEEKERMEHRKSEEEARKKKQILESMKAIKEKSEKRENNFKSGNQRLKQVLKQRKYHEKLSESFNEKQSNELEERKKKLAQIRNFHKPVDMSQIQQHEQRFLEIKRQKQELRQRQKRMNESRSKSYKAPYESMYYKQLVDHSNEEDHFTQKQRADKMKQFAEHVKNNFSPHIDQKKKKKIQEMLEKEQQRKEYWEQRHKELVQKPKLKGLEYLEQVRKIPKKRSGTSSPQSSMNRANLTQRPQYPNYISRSENMSQSKPWKTILKSNGDKQEKALLLHFQSERVEEELKRKEQKTRLAKEKDTGDIDQQYFEMIKAKLDLLQDPQ